jgi:hypothetical protein
LKDHPQTGSSEKAAMIASMVEKNLVPCNSATIYRLMQNHHKGKACPNPDWVKGRPPLLSHQAKSELKECMMKDVGRSFGKDDINDMIVNKRNEMIKEVGHIPINTNAELTATTINNYVAGFAMDSAMSLTQTSIRKTNTRYVAENSIVGSICLLFLIAATHFIPIPEEDLDVQRELKDQPA